MCWVRVVLLPTLPSNWKSWNVSLSPTTFIHNYKKQVILHINIDFHYKAMYNYHQLVSLLFSLHDCMSLNKNNYWCPFASTFRLESRRLLVLTLKLVLLMTGFLDTEIAPAVKLTPQNKGQNVDTNLLNGRDLWYSSWMAESSTGIKNGFPTYE